MTKEELMIDSAIRKLNSLELYYVSTPQKQTVAYNKLDEFLKRDLKGWRITLNNRNGFDNLITMFNEIDVSYLGFLTPKDNEIFVDRFNNVLREIIKYLEELEEEQQRIIGKTMKLNRQAFKKEVIKYTIGSRIETFIESMSDDDLDGFVAIFIIKVRDLLRENPDDLTQVVKYRFIIDYNLIEKFAEFIEVNMKYYREEEG